MTKFVADADLECMAERFLQNEATLEEPNNQIGMNVTSNVLPVERLSGVTGDFRNE